MKILNIQLSLFEEVPTLGDEATPYEMEVKKVATGIRLVTISCDESNKDYFSTLLYGYKS